MPLGGDVRALRLLPEFVKSIELARHPSSRRRGACAAIAGTVRVCRCLSCCVRWPCAFAWSEGLDSWLSRFGDGALGEAGCNDQLLAIVLCLGCVRGAIACHWLPVCGGHLVSPTGDLRCLCSVGALGGPLLGFEGARFPVWPRCHPGAVCDLCLLSLCVCISIFLCVCVRVSVCVCVCVVDMSIII